MKKNTYILLVIITGFLIFQSCKKCATCTETIIETTDIPTDGYPATSERTFELCGDDLKNAPKGTVTMVWSPYGHETHTRETTTKCD